MSLGEVFQKLHRFMLMLPTALICVSDHECQHKPPVLTQTKLHFCCLPNKIINNKINTMQQFYLKLHNPSDCTLTCKNGNHWRL